MNNLLLKLKLARLILTDDPRRSVLSVCSDLSIIGKSRVLKLFYLIYDSLRLCSRTELKLI